MPREQDRSEVVKDNIIIDVNKYYNQYLQTLDKWRSCNSPLEEITVDNVNSVISGSINPVESRCHAFYRFIGFPVLGSDNSFFTPGSGMTAEQTRNAVTISRSLLAKDNLKKIIGERTNYQKEVNDIFQKNTIGSSVLCLSIKNIDKLNYFFEKSLDKDPYSLDINSQVNTAKNEIIYKSEDDNISMLSYYFSDIQFTAEKELSKFKLKHLIRPFLVDPRISFSAGEKSFRIPFPNKKIKSPSPPTFLELTCEDRYINKTKPLTAAEKNALSKVPVINQTVNSKQNYNSQVYYNFSVKMQYVIRQLIESIRKVKNASSFYYFLPIPSRLGLENGVSLSKIYSDNKYNLDVEKEIISLNAQIAIRNINLNSDNILSSINSVINPITEKPVSGPATDSPATLPGITTDSNTKNFENQLIPLRNSRNEYCLEACESLQKIEFITGTFTGLGIIDYLVILNALYLIDEKDLFGLLTEDSFNNFKEKVNATSIDRNSSILDSLNKFSEVVKTLYDTTQSIYEATLKQN